MKTGFIEGFREPPAIILVHGGFHYDYIGNVRLNKLHRQTFGMNFCWGQPGWPPLLRQFHRLHGKCLALNVACALMFMFRVRPGVFADFARYI